MKVPLEVLRRESFSLSLVAYISSGIGPYSLLRPQSNSTNIPGQIQDKLQAGIEGEGSS